MDRLALLGAWEVQLGVLYAFVIPGVVLLLSTLALMLPAGRAGLSCNPAPRQFMEVVFAFVSVALALALAGGLAAQRRRSEGVGSLPAASPLFGGLLFFTVLIITGLSFIPTIVLGPLAERANSLPPLTGPVIPDRFTP